MIWYDPFIPWISFWVLSWLPPSVAFSWAPSLLGPFPGASMPLLCALWRPSPGGRKKPTRKDAQGHTRTHKPKLSQMARKWKTMQEISSIDFDWLRAAKNESSALESDAAEIKSYHVFFLHLVGCLWVRSSKKRWIKRQNLSMNSANNNGIRPWNIDDLPIIRGVLLQ